MTPPEPPKDNPFRLNGTRIMLLVLIALATLTIIGALTGGLTGYQQLREGTLEQQAQ